MKHKKLASIVAVSCFALAASVISFSGEAVPAKEVTFTKQVAPILFKSCAECHRPGEAAPFSVLTYKDTRPWARSIREKVVTRQMPPWHADPHFGEFKNDRRLTQQEIETIVAWVDAGSPEGAARDLPPPPRFNLGWNIGKPDVIFQALDEYAVAADGPDEYVNFYIPTNFTEDKYIERAEARPGNRKIVHHIVVEVIPASRMNNAGQSRGPQKKTLGRTGAEVPVHDDTCSMSDQSFEEADWIAQYAPGLNPDVYEPGTAKRVAAGSTLRLQVHYSKTAGTPEVDRSMVGLVFAKEPPSQVIRKGAVGNESFKILPNTERHRVAACWTTKRDIRVYSFLPHMHLRGAAMEYKVIYPDGKSEVLLNVPNYSFSWQTSYLLKTPKVLPKGTRMIVTAHYDNSAKNKFNPDPTRAVRNGEPTYDEMMLGIFDFVPIPGSDNK